MDERIIKQPRQIGLYVRRVREVRGLSRKCLAQRAGVSERLMASLELGDATGIRLDKLMAVLGALDMSLLVQLPHTPDDCVSGADGEASDSSDPLEAGAAAERVTGARQSYGEAFSRFLSGQGIEVSDNDLPMDTSGGA